MSQQTISKIDIARSFGKAAESYDQAAHFQRWVGNELLARIKGDEYQSVLDIGCGTGFFASGLVDKSRSSEKFYLGLDLALPMLEHGKRERNLDSDSHWLAGDAENLPFIDGSVDLAFSSLAIQWCSDLPALFKEIYRVLKPGGIFAFSTLLDGSLKELKASWSKVDGYQHVNQFALVDEYREPAEFAGFQNVICDQVSHVLFYDQVRELTRELKGIGAHNMTEKRPSGLTGKSKLKQFLSSYESFRNESGKLPATYEVLLCVLSKPLNN